jgi:hypothetical protein
MEPTYKSKSISDFLNILSDRSNSIKNNKCIRKPIGCERQMNEDEINSWDELTQQEYLISGLCDMCQRKVFS